MFGEPSLSSPEQDELRKDPEMTPGAIRKISMLPRIKKQLPSKKHPPSSRETHLSERQSSDHHTLDGASDMSRTSICATRSSASTTPTSRYTISCLVGSVADKIAPPSKPQSCSDMKQQVITRHQTRLEPSVKDNLYRKPSYATPAADFAASQCQTPATTPPLVANDVESRLEGLKSFKAWNERVHESSHQHEEAQLKARRCDTDTKTDGDMVHCNRSAGPAYVASNVCYEKPHINGAEVVETRLAAPTPFSSPQIIPVSAGATSRPIQDSDLSYSASLPAPNLQPRLELERSDSGRASPRTIIISATPVAAHERLSRSRSRSSSGPASEKSGPRSSSQQGDKKYPPVSFPKIYNEKVSGAKPFQTNSKPQPIHRTDSTVAITPSVSLVADPTVRASNDVQDHQETLSTAHEKLARPVFYTLVHYYVECPHASPPATRPLDADAQPRLDPDFHPSRPGITRSIISGMCFNCDTAYRRERENEIVNTCTVQIAEATRRLATLVEQLELDNPESSDSESDIIQDRHSARLHSHHRFAEDALDLRHQLSNLSLPPLSDDPSVPNTPARARRRIPDQDAYQQICNVKRIRILEADIDKLREAQDRQVKQVWAGYTRRWGPATLGVQRGAWSMSIERYQMRDDHDMLLEQQKQSIDQRSAVPDETRPLEEDADTQNVGLVDRENGDARDGGMSALSSDESNTTSQERLGSRDRCRGESHSRSRSGSRSITRSLSRNGRRTPSTVRTDTSMTSSSTASHRDLPGSKVPGEGKMRIGWIRE